MPELPEVEVVCRGLEQITRRHSKITKLEFRRKDLRDPMPIATLQTFVGAKILKIQRRAKYILMHTEAGIILSHLGMSGSWRFENSNAFQDRTHDHVLIHLPGGVLIYNDPRRFGIFENIESETENKRLKKLAPEPLSEDFTSEYLAAVLRNVQSPIKVAIMDQMKVVGVGNIYASEVLFHCGIRPTRKSALVTRVQASELVRQIKVVLQEAIAAGGSTIHSFVKSDGDAGCFQNQHLVYGREGLPCFVCESKIKQKYLGNRSTFWCPKCQS